MNAKGEQLKIEERGNIFTTFLNKEKATRLIDDLGKLHFCDHLNVDYMPVDNEGKYEIFIFIKVTDDWLNQFLASLRKRGTLFKLGWNENIIKQFDV